jgi:hypothetical protein
MTFHVSVKNCIQNDRIIKKNHENVSVNENTMEEKDTLRLIFQSEGYEIQLKRSLKVADMWIPLWNGSAGRRRAVTWSVNMVTPRALSSHRQIPSSLAVIGSHETVSQDLAPRCDTNQITGTKVLASRSHFKSLTSTAKTWNFPKKRQQDCYVVFVWCWLVFYI